MNRFIERDLQQRFLRVPTEMVVMYDWHSPEGKQFLAAVEAAVEVGTDINEIGVAIGIRNFSNRWRILRGRKGRVLQDGEGHSGTQ